MRSAEIVNFCHTQVIFGQSAGKIGIMPRKTAWTPSGSGTDAVLRGIMPFIAGIMPIFAA